MRPAGAPVSSVNLPCCNGFLEDLAGFEKSASQLVLDPFLAGFKKCTSQLFLDPSVLPVNVPDVGAFLKGLNSEASADNLPWGFLNASALTSFSQVPSDHLPVGFLKVAASVASATFRKSYAVRVSVFSVASETLASVASVAVVRASACRSRHRRREGPGLRGCGRT